MNTKSLIKTAKALSDPTRLRILHEIGQVDRIGCAALYDTVPISQPSMSQHLKALGEAGLVDTTKEGRNIFLSVNPEKLQELEMFLSSIKTK